MTESKLTWANCPIRPRHDSTLVLAPIPDDPDHLLLVAAAWPLYILPFGDRIIDVDELDQYEQGMKCPPNLAGYMREKLSRLQIIDVARMSCDIARMHARYAADAADYAAANYAADYSADYAASAADYAARAAGAAVDAAANAYHNRVSKHEFTITRGSKHECMQHIVDYAVQMVKGERTRG